MLCSVTVSAAWEMFMTKMNGAKYMEEISET